MKKRILAFLLTLVMLFLTSCGGYRPSDVMAVIGDKDSRNPLRICVDFGENVPDVKGLNDFVYRLKHTAGIEEVVIEIVPPYNLSQGGLFAETAERKTVLARLRTEIMAGEGPDVFLMRYKPYENISYEMGTENDYEGTDFLFKYPEKAMENGLFLPLDEYIENNAEFAEWDKLTQPVLEAGRNWEGQQIIPLNYTLPLLCYPKTEWEHIPDKKYTWDDMLRNPELLPYATDLANCGWADVSSESQEKWLYDLDYIHRILGKLVDYENESLRFTEEELLTLINEIRAVERVDRYLEVETAQIQPAGDRLSAIKFNKPMTFLPLYNVDGGVTAYIETYAAVSRNTRRPEEAFKVIDLLMNKDFQANGFLYTEILSTSSLPMNEELYRETDPVNHDKYMIAENYEAFCMVRDQITAANIKSEITVMLEEMMRRINYAEWSGVNPEEIIHETYEHMERRLKE